MVLNDHLGIDSLKALVANFVTPNYVQNAIKTSYQAPQFIEIPDNPLLAAAMASNLSRYRKLNKLDRSITANFVQTPTADIFSLVSSSIHNRIDISAYITIKWALSHYLLNPSSNGLSDTDPTTLTINPTFLFVKPRHKSSLDNLAASLSAWILTVAEDIQYEVIPSLRSSQIQIKIISTDSSHSDFIQSLKDHLNHRLSLKPASINAIIA